MKSVDKAAPSVHDLLVKVNKRTVREYLCHRCFNYWIPKGKPIRCGKCKSPYWSTKRKEKK